ncbi:MAG: cation:proton antiporter [Nanoarchaeota archaeon]|nr:cation:proton antiporter [Nanoarchaeota archaeon]MBU4456817.1 cation:proton antiporter [Nanoarchaeota archaeon]MCG2719644.1 cation:proton antiporter [Nanoarchaeota archaeon]
MIGLDNISSSLLFQVSILLILATVFAYFAKLVRQPLIPAYIITGLVLGPAVLGLVNDNELIRTMSEIGIVFLLFIVGLEMNLRKLKEVGFVTVIAGTIQVILTFILGYSIATLFNFDYYNAIFLGLICAFSSTMVIVKLLSDRDEVDTLHGRLLIGILLVQDVLVIIAMPFLSSLGSFSFSIAFKLVIATAALALIAFLFSKFAMKRIFRFAARSGELLFLLSLSICFLFALVAAFFGFSIAIGAFVAGLMLANLPYHFDIIGKVSPLKDFFSTIFFVSLGMQFTLIGLKDIIWPMAALLTVIIFLKPLIVTLALAMFGYGRHTPFITGSLLGQTSEFSLIIVLAASSFITSEVFSLTIILTVLTITFTSYVVDLDEKIYALFSKRLRFLERISLRPLKELEYHKKINEKRVILIGADRMGSVILNDMLKDKRNNLLVVDSNPEIMSNLIKRKVHCVYGDIASSTILKKLHFQQAKVLISTIPNLETNKKLLKYAKHHNKKLIVIMTADHLQQALDLYEAGADYVMLPRLVSGEGVSQLLAKHKTDKAHIKNQRRKHLKHLLNVNSKMKNLW